MKTTKEQLRQAVEKTGDKFQGFFLDWMNNFLTIKGYANYYGLTEEQAKTRVRIGAKIHNQRTETNEK